MLLIAHARAAQDRTGVERRVDWENTTLTGSPEPPPPFSTAPAFPNLAIEQPLSIDAEPGRDAYLVIQHLGSWAPPGKVLRLTDDPDARDAEVILDLGPDAIAYELAFHPGHESNGHLFLGHNRKVGETNYTRVSRYTVDRRPPHHIDPASELVIIEWPSNGHNGGAVDFGGDGMLYVTSGDGTGDSDTDLRGQDLTELTSKVLRIDVDHPDPGRAYSVPPDNPFVGRPNVRPETWAYGLRNPWRMSYDRGLDQLWVGQNGQDLWESVVLVRPGANYGWSVNEGNHPFLPNHAAGPDPISPVTVEHHHSEARSLTGGVVYHGAALPELRGAYVYGDWSTGKIWGVKHDGTEVIWRAELADTSFQITGFGLDRDGELLVIDHVTGFHRLVRNESPPGPPFPTLLSETGLYDSVAERRLHPALITYSVNSALWSDGAAKARAFVLPTGGRIGFKAGSQGWDFPEGSVLLKEFAFDLAGDGSEQSRAVETRLMIKRQGEWFGYSYAWNEAGTDASLVAAAGADRPLQVTDESTAGGRRAQTWHYPSRAECLVCHSRAANWSLGLSTAQMNRDRDGGGAPVNQISHLSRLGLFSDPPAQSPDELERLADPADPAAPLESRARSYLHANCAGCHVEAGGGNAAINLSADAPDGRAGLLEVQPQHDRFGLGPDARLVAAGDPSRSVLWLRVNRRGAGQMPPLASSLVDPLGSALVRDWIRGLARADSAGPPKAAAD